VESFNGRLRDELLDRELFLSLPEARVVLDSGLRPSLRHTIRTVPQRSHEHWYRNWGGINQRLRRRAAKTSSTRPPLIHTVGSGTTMRLTKFEPIGVVTLLP